MSTVEFHKEEHRVNCRGISTTREELGEAVRRAAPPKEYALIYKKWQDAYEARSMELARLILDHAVNIESLAFAGNVSGIRLAHYNLIRQLFQEISPNQQKTIWGECRLKRRWN